MRIHKTLFLAPLLVLFGCSSPINDPTVYNQNTRVPQSFRPISNVLFVYDISLEVPRLPKGGMLESTDDYINTKFKTVFLKLNGWADKQGIKIETRIHKGPGRLIVNPTGFSHVIVERVRSEHAQTSFGYPRLFNRNWSAEVFEIIPSTPPSTRTLHTEEYASDGIDCFTAPAIPNREACQAAYLRLISNHLKQIDPAVASVE